MLRVSQSISRPLSRGKKLYYAQNPADVSCMTAVPLGRALQMRHELFGTNLQVLHFIEHGIEDEVQGTGADDLLNLFDAFITTSPNTDTGAEIGILIA